MAMWTFLCVLVVVVVFHDTNARVFWETEEIAEERKC
jgi:hypothetical protein